MTEKRELTNAEAYYFLDMKDTMEYLYGPWINDGMVTILNTYIKRGVIKGLKVWQ